MIDEYMNKYRGQMDKVTLSDSADQAILNELLKADSRKETSYKKRSKRNISAAMVAAAIVIASSVTACAGVVIHRAIIQSNKEESQIEGVGTVDVGESYYYDLLAGNTGELYALTDNDYDGALTDHHAVAWKSTDQGDTWEEILLQPNELHEESYLLAGDLREGEAGIEAVVIIEEKNGKAENSQINRVYQIKADSYVEYDMDEVYTQLGGQEHLWSVKYVNEHIIALVGIEECLLYDTNMQKVVKNLPYDLSMGCLKTQDQFLLYGKEIYCCVNVETLEEQEPEEGLREFVEMMYEKNQNEVFPPMAAWNDTVACVTKTGIYEYREGEITQIRWLSGSAVGGHAFNGLLPICKTRDGKYYVCTFSDTGMSLWQIDGDDEKMKQGGKL